jgi:hypothetical protein
MGIGSWIGLIGLGVWPAVLDKGNEISDSIKCREFLD